MSDPKVLDPLDYMSEKEAEELEKLGMKLINYNGFAILQGPNQSLQYFDDVHHALNNSKSSVAAVVGRPGSGKSYLALRLAEMFDPNFDVDKQVLFCREDILDVMSGKVEVKQKQCIILDESHIAIGSRNWAASEQKSIVELLATIRHLGLLVFIIVLHPTQLDSQVRNFLLNYQIHQESPGNAVVYATTMSRFESTQYKRRLEDLCLQLPGVEDCEFPDCLRCSHVNTCNNIRAKYERKKRAYLQTLTTDTTEAIEEKQLAAAQSTMKLSDYVEIVRANADKVRINRLGNADSSSVHLLLQGLGCKVGLIMANSIAKAYDSFLRSERGTAQTEQTDA